MYDDRERLFDPASCGLDLLDVSRQTLVDQIYSETGSGWIKIAVVRDLVTRLLSAYLHLKRIRKAKQKSRGDGQDAQEDDSGDHNRRHLRRNSRQLGGRSSGDHVERERDVLVDGARDNFVFSTDAVVAQNDAASERGILGGRGQTERDGETKFRRGHFKVDGGDASGHERRRVLDSLEGEASAEGGRNGSTSSTGAAPSVQDGGGGGQKHFPWRRWRGGGGQGRPVTPMLLILLRGSKERVIRVLLYSMRTELGRYCPSLRLWTVWRMRLRWRGLPFGRKRACADWLTRRSKALSPSKRCRCGVFCFFSTGATYEGSDAMRVVRTVTFRWIMTRND